MKNIAVVYYIFINPQRDWKKIVKGQLSDLQFSGLLEQSRLYVHITDTSNKYIPECKKLVSSFYSREIIFSSNQENQYEYPGFKLMYNIAQEYTDAAILYLHTKGMVYHHTNDRDMCEKTILRYTIDNWEKTLSLFDKNQILNKIGVYPSTEGWIWFNIFWIRSDYLQNCNPPDYTPENRYYYESYIGREAPKINNGYSDCYSLAERKVIGYTQSYLFDLIYEPSILNYDMRRLPGGVDVNVKFNKKEFFYGTDYTKINVTEIVYKKCVINDVLFIPSDDIERAKIFGDPEFGSHKYIFIDNVKYTPSSSIYIDTFTDKMYILDDLPEEIKKANVYGYIKQIHTQLKVNHGDISSEYPEQCISARFIKGNEKVLEIGSNIGRNTLIISYLLNDSSNLLSLECDPVSYNKLIENKTINNFHFHAENAALSARKLIQKGWDTIPSETLLEGYQWVNTITLPELKNKYPIDFDTLVLDCEGAFYYIVMDYPEILNGINLIIMENDYHNYSHKQYIDEVLKTNNFDIVYSEGNGWGHCKDNFYEVWKR